MEQYPDRVALIWERDEPGDQHYVTYRYIVHCIPANSSVYSYIMGMFSTVMKVVVRRRVSEKNVCPCTRNIHVYWQECALRSNFLISRTLCALAHCLSIVFCAQARCYTACFYYSGGTLYRTHACTYIHVHTCIHVYCVLHRQRKQGGTFSPTKIVL